MSILIPDMKMPKDGCKSCGFYILGICLIKANMDKPYEVTHSCPLIELPPHGDLIDREKIPFVEVEYACDDYAFRYDINEMTPVIPADPEGGADG